MKRPEQILTEYLKKNGLSIAFAESMTCGLAAHKLGNTNGTSKVLRGSIVCYDETVKTTLLKVPKKLIEECSCESQEVTDALVKNLPKLMKADVYAAITGLAADGGSESKNKPVGTVFFSLRFKNKAFKLRKRFRGSPLEIKEKACAELFRLIIKKLKQA
jgi:nicotinamide-nucleotide amidase